MDEPELSDELLIYVHEVMWPSEAWTISDRLERAKKGSAVKNVAREMKRLGWTPPVNPLVEEIREQLGPKFLHLAEYVAQEYRARLPELKGSDA